MAVPFANYIAKKIRKESENALTHQEKIFKNLLYEARNTQFAQDHAFKHITNHEEYIQAVPIRDYELLKPYIEKIKEGTPHVLWKGLPLYFAKTSGTTSGVKYIPISKESMPAHITAARNALLCYIAETKNVQFVNGKMIFLSGSPVLDKIAGIYTGRLSGIVNHHVPAYLNKNRLPSYNTNCIEDWEKKLEAIIEETINQDMTLISGIPPWMQMYFDKLQIKAGKKIGELFPNFSVLVHGGVNFEPYKAKLFESIGKKIDTIETFPASEGFFAFQDTQQEEGLLLNCNAGMFYEFIPLDEISKEKPKRITLHEVKIGVQYALILSTNAGLWAYNLGDTIKFVSTNPYRIVVTGRIKHFISAFGEHVIAEEVEYAMKKTSEMFQCHIVEFTVAPLIAKTDNKSRHQWFIAFDTMPPNMEAFAIELNKNLCEKNIYYKDLIIGNILQPLEIICLQKDAFIQYMKSIGKLGGQNKVPRLSNDRNIADALMKYKIQ